MSTLPHQRLGVDVCELCCVLAGSQFRPHLPLQGSHVSAPLTSKKDGQGNPITATQMSRRLFKTTQPSLRRKDRLRIEVFYDPSKPAVLPRIARETLAEMIDTTRSRVNFFMNEFKKLRFIEYAGFGFPDLGPRPRTDFSIGTTANRVRALGSSGRWARSWQS
jgi:hypothetical protein